jgi:hypothetical protein
VGIVFIVLLLVVVGLFVGYVVYRRRHQQDVIPRRVRQSARDIGNRISFWNHQNPPPYSESEDGATGFNFETVTEKKKIEDLENVVNVTATPAPQSNGEALRAVRPAESLPSSVTEEHKVSYVASNAVNLGFRGDVEDIYQYGTSESLMDIWAESSDKVTIEEVIDKGRFAVIRKGVLKTAEGNREVAVKMAKSMFSKTSRFFILLVLQMLQTLFQATTKF